MRTEYGLRYKIVYEIKEDWCVYDKVIAKTHLNNYGYIIVDPEYGTPIDNEYDLFVIHGMIKSAS